MSIYTTKEIAYPYYGLKSYRIEIDITNPSKPIQRHIWTYEDGSIKEGGWIDSFKETTEQLLAKGYELKKD